MSYLQQPTFTYSYEAFFFRQSLDTPNTYFMNFFERTFNYFSSRFFNNAALKHNALGSLRIFFERNNKLRNPINSLGNVFRNSKWSDFTLKNLDDFSIKSGFNRLLVWFMFLLVLSAAMLIGYTNNLFVYLPSINTFFEQTSLIFYQKIEAVKVWCVATYIMLQSFTTTLKQFITRSRNRIIHNTDNQTSFGRSSHTVRPEVYSRIQFGFSKPRVTLPWLESSFYLNRIYSSMDDTNATYPHADVFYTPYKVISPLPANLSLLHVINSGSYGVDLYHQYPLFKRESDYTISSLCPEAYARLGLPVGWQQLFNTTTWSKPLVADVNKILTLGTSDIQTEPTTLGIKVLMDAAKQHRWLMRNALTAENLDTHNNAYTQMKKLIGTHLLLSGSSNTNIWLSAQISNLSPYKSINVVNSLIDRNYPSLFKSKASKLLSNPTAIPDLVNLNFVESSRLWTSQKYALTSNMSSTVIASSADRRGVFEAEVEAANLRSALDLFITINTNSLTSNLSDLNLVTNTTTFPEIEDCSLSLFFGQDDYADIDLILNGDLNFISLLTSNITTDRRLYGFRTFGR